MTGSEHSGTRSAESVRRGNREHESQTPKILVTNDDGVGSPGMTRLAEALARDHDVVVAAPAEDFSGSGTGIGRFSPSAGVQVSASESEFHRSHAIDGPPGLAVLAAELGAFGDPPDLVVSGPNRGMNTGHSVIHSGTVGAVLGARTFGKSGVALSLASSESWYWGTAVYVGVRMVEWILDQGDDLITLNVNVPALPVEELKPARWARLDDFGYFHIADADLDQQLLKFESGGSAAGRDPGCDTALCRAGHVAITPLTAVQTDDFPEMDPQTLLEG